MDLDGGLTKWINDVAKYADLSVDEKSKITGAGAKVFAQYLRRNTPISTRNYDHPRRAGHGRKKMHLRDAITYAPGFTSDKIHTGNTSVGWNDSYSAMVARFVNDGVPTGSANDFINRNFKNRTETEAREAVLRANAEAYRKVRKG